MQEISAFIGRIVLEETGLLGGIGQHQLSQPGALEPCVGVSALDVHLCHRLWQPGCFQHLYPGVLSEGKDENAVTLGYYAVRPNVAVKVVDGID